MKKAIILGLIFTLACTQPNRKPIPLYNFDDFQAQEEVLYPAGDTSALRPTERWASLPIYQAP